MARRFGTGSNLTQLCCDTWDDEESLSPSIAEIKTTRVPRGGKTLLGVETVGIKSLNSRRKPPALQH
jgi:hypothetical protein